MYRTLALALQWSRTYLASDGLGSETVDLSYNGSVLATALYGPYGVGRYATGTMPSSKGYTGQRQDSGSGLDYYNARYYDGAIGQFTSADSVQGPNRYGYVGGNPETANDPTGKRRCDDRGACGGDGGGDGGGDYCNRLLCPHGSTDSTPPTSRTAPPKPQIGCQASSRICGDITKEYHDPKTQLLLDALTYSDIGMKFLVFLLAVGAQIGDYYISWEKGGCTCVDMWGNIHLDTTQLPDLSDPNVLTDDPNALADIIGYAGGLIHEAVESYYSIADGIQSHASLHMDYTAQWFAGEARLEMATTLGIDMSNVPGTDSYRESYADWVNSPDGQAYVSLGEKPNQPEVTDSWGRRLSSLDSDPYWQGFDAMGLTESMLTASII